MNSFAKLFFLFLLAFFAGCHATLVQNDYQKQLNAWTRSGERYQNEAFYVSVKWSATLLNREMLKIQAQEVGNIYASAAERQNFLAEQLAHYGDNTSFFISFYGFDRKNSDLANPKTDWKLTLSSRGRESEPLKIQKIKPTPLQRHLFPYINTWSSCYIVTFPKVNHHTALGLSVRGPYGHDTLSW